MANELERFDWQPYVDGTVDADGCFDALSHSYRRFVLARLGGENELSLETIARDLAAWKCERPRENVPADAVRSVRITLHHVHVPRLADVGLVEYDRERRQVALAEGCADVASHPAVPTVET